MKKFIFLFFVAVFIFSGCFFVKKQYPIVVTDSKQLTEANQLLKTIKDTKTSGSSDFIRDELSDLDERFISDLQQGIVSDDKAADIIYELNYGLLTLKEPPANSGDKEPSKESPAGNSSSDMVVQRIQKILQTEEDNFVPPASSGQNSK